MHRKQKRHMAASISFCGNSERLCVCGCVCVIIECRASEKKILDFDGVLSLSLSFMYLSAFVCVCCFVLSAISLIRSAFRTLLSRLRFKERKGMMCWRHSPFWMFRGRALIFRLWIGTRKWNNTTSGRGNVPGQLISLRHVHKADEETDELRPTPDGEAEREREKKETGQSQPTHKWMKHNTSE